jgi:hypothetical protein
MSLLMSRLRSANVFLGWSIAAEDYRSPRRFADSGTMERASVVDCASPLALWSAPGQMEPRDTALVRSVGRLSKSGRGLPQSKTLRGFRHRRAR